MRVLLALIFTLTNLQAWGQVPAPKQFINGTVPTGVQAETNYVRNPSAFPSLVTIGTTKSGSPSLVRSTSAGLKWDGISSFAFDTAANSEYVEFATNTISDQHTTGNCEAHLAIKGDGTLYSLQVTDGTTVLNSLALPNATNWTTVGFTWACGTTRKLRVTQTTAGTSPSINIADVYWGPQTKVSKDTLTAKGYIYVATASGTVTGKAPGANGEVLSADSTQTDGLKWIASSASPWNSSIRADTFASYASTNTKVIRWNNQVTVGTDLTFSDTAAGGGKVTVNTSGVYALVITFSGDTGYGAGAVKNGTQGSLAIFSTTFTTHLCHITSAGADSAPCAYTGYFTAGDYVWAQTDGVANTLSPTRALWTMARVN